MTRRAPGREPERTADGRYVVVDGRRWRATDPAIAERDAAVLRRWLMAARRDVGTATRAGDAAGESAARARVHAAKTALGERGPAWWEQSDDERRARRDDGLRLALAEGFVPTAPTTPAAPTTEDPMTTPPTQADPNPDDPNPARSSATLSAFTGQVQRRLGLQTESEAEVLTRAVLNKLGQAISSGIAQDLTVALPPELSAELRAQNRSDDQARSVDRAQFVDAVSGVVSSVDTDEVTRQVEQVLRLLREWLPEDQVDRTLEQLPGDLAELMR